MNIVQIHDTRFTNYDAIDNLSLNSYHFKSWTSYIQKCNFQNSV